MEGSRTSPMNAAAVVAASDRLRWWWIGIGVLGGAALIGFFVHIVDPTVSRPELAMLVATLTLILVGVLVGYKSPGETVREAGVAGLVVAALAFAFAYVVLELRPSGFILLLALFYAPSFAMTGGWVGEMLQGTLADEPSERLEWAWIAVGVVIGFMLNVYSVFIVGATLSLSNVGVFICFALSFIVTGYIVGYFSPGITVLEPAIAALGMIVLDTLLVFLYFEAPFPFSAILLGAFGGFLLALAGGWMGEYAQASVAALRQRQRAVAEPTA